VRNIGSGNIGATNVLRTGRKDLALLTLLLDSGKGAIAVFIVALLTNGNQMVMAIAGAAAFIGHCFPLYLKFKGGKGVATFIGTLLGFNIAIMLVAGGLWLATAAISRYSSLSALVMAGITPFLFLVFGQFAFFGGSLVMTGLIFARHKPNILRLLDGTEPKIGQKG
ncbi:MAG: glycerol-3-phosphate 1-O-acyltransferase PlsY, partial [Pseudomonadota bacterium]